MPESSSLSDQEIVLCAADSEIGQHRRHHPATVMGDPGLLHERPDIAALLPQGGGDREQLAAADRTWAELDGKADLALDHRLAQGTLTTMPPKVLPSSSIAAAVDRLSPWTEHRHHSGDQDPLPAPLSGGIVAISPRLTATPSSCLSSAWVLLKFNRKSTYTTDAGGEIASLRLLLDCVELEGLLVQADALHANRPFSSTSSSVAPTF
jgi:hypothetical protein